MIRECDYCERMLDEDEDTHPIFIGEMPKPEVIRYTEHTAKAAKRETVAYGEGGGGIQVLGRPVDEIMAILSTIENCENIDLKTYNRVNSVESANVDLGSPNPTRLSTTEHDDFLAAEITVRPKREDVEPDMKVCQFCKAEFENND